MVPNSGERKQILNGMKESFPARKAWIVDKHPTIHEVLEKFPHLISYDGELVSSSNLVLSLNNKIRLILIQDSMLNLHLYYRLKRSSNYYTQL